MGLAMLERMEHLGVKLHRNSYHQVIKAVSGSKNFQAGVRLFETMVRTGSMLLLFHCG